MAARRRRPDPETLSSAPSPSAAAAASPADRGESAAHLGRYELLFELASGGMGTVYAARLLGAHGFDRVVAIKRLRSGEVEVEPFLAEARIGARITHPNVVQTLELGVDERGAPFIVMQLVEGLSLAQFVQQLERSGETLDFDLAAWIVAQSAAGLHAAHEVETTDGRTAALVHRDVSPQNLLLSFDGRVYVTDFGIAKLFLPEGQTDSGSIKGKFAYMSPEQTRGAALDRRSDIFALGIVLYELITSTRLFASTSPVDTIMRVVTHEPDPPEALRPGLPSELAAITMKCLHKRVDDRFATMAELGDALRAYLHRQRAAIDEHALAALLDRLCGDRKERLRQRLRSYGGTDGPPAEAHQEVQITRLDAPPVVSTQGRTQSTKRWMLAATSAFVFLGAIGILFGLWTYRGRRAEASTSPDRPTVAAPSTTPAESAKPLPAATATVVAAPPVETNTAPSPVAAGARGPHRASGAGAIPLPAPATSPTRRPSNPARSAVSGAASTPAPPASAPFRRLGD